MSEDGFSDSYEDPNMEIQIQTLMGTYIDLVVAPTDTIRDIKQRIQRVEGRGVPTGQVNLLYRYKELSDSTRLCDAGIKDGSTLKLVLSMRGGPISTRRLNASCDHHFVLKELKELLENTRDEIGDKLSPGAKVSVLVFREGEVLNLLRVIENEDGSYSPYSEKAITPPSATSSKSRRWRMALFEKLMEDNRMMAKLKVLRQKMQDLNARKQARLLLNTTTTSPTKIVLSSTVNKSEEEMKNCLLTITSERDLLAEINYQLLDDSSKEFDILDEENLKILEKSDDDAHSENDEIALKDKHRSKGRSPRGRLGSTSTCSLYSETKGALSHTKQTYARMHKNHIDFKSAAAGDMLRDHCVDRSEELVSPARLSPLCLKAGPAGDTGELDRALTPTLVEEMSLPSSTSARGVHVTRLVLSADNTERPKSTVSDTLSELEESAAQDLWEFTEPAAQRLKHGGSSATCKVGGGVNRRQSVDYGYDGIENTPNVPQDISGELEVCSSNFYHMPQFMASPSAIPPQYAPKENEVCNYYFTNPARSPLYGRKVNTDQLSSRNTEDFNKSLPKLPDIGATRATSPLATPTLDKYKTYLNDCSTIQRLKNDCNLDPTSSTADFYEEEPSTIDELYGYYNLGCSPSKFLDRNDFKLKALSGVKEVKEVAPSSILERKELPPVIKKKARCMFCNKRLNITNIHSCRCGRIFCSQHRYSEVHNCNYDYKTSGRKFLEQQNPLVTAEKVHRF